MSQPYKSGRQKNLNLGITSVTENDTILQVTGKVGIGTTLAGQRSLYVIGDAEITGTPLGVTTIATKGGITTTGGDLYVGKDLFVKQNFVISGLTTFKSDVDIDGSLNVDTNVTVTGLSTFVGIVTNQSTIFGRQLNISGFGTVTNLVSTAVSFAQLQVTGISTFTNGPVLIGSATSTGTAAQRLQVTGGAQVSGSVGIGTSNPRETLDVIGTVGVQASGSSNRFEIQHNAALNSLDFMFI